MIKGGGGIVTRLKIHVLLLVSPPFLGMGERKRRVAGIREG